MSAELDAFLLELTAFITDIGQLEGVATTQTVAEDTVYKIEGYLNVVTAILDSLHADEADPDLRQLIDMFSDLLKDLEGILKRWLDFEMGIDPDSPCIGLKAEKRHCDGRGRPKYVIKREQILFLRDLRFTWTKISKMYGVSRRTLYNIRSDLGLIEPHYHNFTPITDDDLKETIKDIKRVMPEAGQNIIRGLLEARDIHVSIIRIRECIIEVDPVNTALRWAQTRRRRVYSVPHPNAVWHLDGNHKLVRYVVFVMTICVSTFTLYIGGGWWYMEG